MASTLARTYRETLDLMIQARNYLTYVHGRERLQVRGQERLQMSVEALRVTSRLAQVMAWVMAQRAVEAGEMTPARACDEFGLSGQDVCLDTAHHDDASLPRGLRELMGRSHELYVRASRLDGMARRRLH